MTKKQIEQSDIIRRRISDLEGHLLNIEEIKRLHKIQVEPVLHFFSLSILLHKMPDDFMPNYIDQIKAIIIEEEKKLMEL